MSLTQITDELKDKGFSSHKGYISKLQNGKLPPAGEDLNRALADITGGDAQKLIWAAYVEKAPEELKGLLSNVDDLDNLYNHAIDLYALNITRNGKILPEYSEHLYSILKPRYKENITLEWFSDPEYFKSGFKKMDIESKGAMLEFILNNYVLNEEDKLQSSINQSTTKFHEQNSNISLYENYLINAKKIINQTSPDELNQTMISEAIISAYNALEIRVNEVLLKSIENSGISKEIGIDVLRDLTLSKKIHNEIEKYLDYDITNEPFFLELWTGIALRNQIVYNALSEPVSIELAKKMVMTMEKAINTINSHAKQKGFE
jgi:hypothetical protein